MTEDQDQRETPKTEAKRATASEKLFKARERMRTDIVSEGEPPPRTAKRETGEPLRVDWDKVDRADTILLSDADEIHAKLAQNPNRKDKQELEAQVATLSEGVGRDKKSAADMEARLYGLGFVQQRALEKLPGGIRVLVDRMERPKGYTDYMEAGRSLESEMGRLGAELGDKKMREVRNLLERRREVNRLIDYFDYVQSGRRSLQEQVIEAVGRNAPEQTLRRMAANALENAWKQLGFSELRPTTMYSQARLRMEREEADPIILMASKIAEDRGSIEQDVKDRLKEEGVEVSGVGEAGETEVEEEVLPHEAAEVVAGEAPAEEAEVSSEEAEERASREETTLPAEEKQILDDLEGLSRKEIISGLQAVMDRVESGEISSKQQLYQEAARVLGIQPERGNKPKAEEPEQTVKAAEASRAKEPSAVEEEKLLEKELEDKVEEAVAKGTEWTRGKDVGAARQLLRELAEGRKSINDLANEIFPGKENRGKRDAFREQFKRGLLSAGIIKEEEARGQSISTLEKIFRKAINKTLEEDRRLADREELRKSRRQLFWADALEGTWDHLKAAVHRGIADTG